MKMSMFKPKYKDFYKHLIENIDVKRDFSKLNQYLLKTHTKKFSGNVFHGSPKEGLLSMLTEGIVGTQHGEISDYDTFSTSLNPTSLSMFSEGDGDTGIEFSIKNANVLILNDMIAHLTSQEVGSGMEFDVDEDELEEFGNQFNIPKNNYHGYYLPWNFITNLGVDAWCNIHSIIFMKNVEIYSF